MPEAPDTLKIETGPRLITDLEPTDLQVTVAPPEIFENNQGGEITDVASNGNYTFVVRKGEGNQSEVLAYNELGRRLPPEDLPRKVTLNDVRDLAQKKRWDTIFWLKDYQYLEGYYKTWVRPLIPNALARDFKAVRESLQQNFTGGYIRTNKISGFDMVLYEPGKIRVKTNSSEDFFVVQDGEDKVSFYKVREGDKILQPNEWTKTHFARGSKELAEAFASLPEDLKSELLIFSDRAVRIKDTDHTAVFEESGTLSVIDTKTRQRLFSVGTRDFSLDSGDEDTLYMINPQKSRTLTLVRASEIAQRNWRPVDRQLADIKGEPQEIRHDPNGNFVLVMSRENGNGWLSVYEKESLQKIEEIADVKGELEVDRNGNIFFADSQDRLRMASTNFNAFPKGVTLGKARAERLERLKERLAGLTPEELEKYLKEAEKPQAQEGESPEEAARRALAGKLEELFGERIKEAKTLENLGGLSQQLEALKGIAEFADHPEAFAPFEQRIAELTNTIKLGQLNELLALLKEDSIDIKGFEDALSLEQQLKELLEIRQGVAIKDRALRREIDKGIQALSKQISEQLDRYQQEFMGQISEQFETVEELIKASGSADELSNLRVAPEVEVLEGWVSKIKDTTLARELRARLREAFRAQQESINLHRAQAEAEERFRAAGVIEEIRAATEDVSQLVDTTIATPIEFDSWSRNNPHITKIRAEILGLPQDLRKEQEERLEEFLRTKRHDVEYKQRLGIKPQEKGAGRTVKFGKEEFPIYEPPKIVWQPKITPLAPGSEYGFLVFEDNAGRVFRPELGTVPLKMDDVTTAEAIRIFTPEAADYFNSLHRNVPAFNENWVLSPFYTDRLEDMARLLNIQARQQRGIYILEGEAGTGKNVLFEIFAHFTNREFSNFACNMQTEKEDVTYAFRFDPVKGTYQVDSRVVEALKTPGAIINFDEINTLPPGVAKMLNPLLDHRRTLFFPEGKRQQKADPSVLITGTMNPQHYLGTRPLSQEVKSRARISKVDYPPEREGGKKTGRILPDEAMIYAKYIPSLQDLTPEEFTRLWDFHINGNAGSGGDRYTTPEAEADTRKVAELIKVANKIREAYNAFRTGQSTDIVEFVFSLREGIDTVSEMTAFPNVKEAIKDVVLPKIADPAERERIRALTDQR